MVASKLIARDHFFTRVDSGAVVRIETVAPVRCFDSPLANQRTEQLANKLGDKSGSLAGQITRELHRNYTYDSYWG